jgi:hypothetical protein
MIKMIKMSTDSIVITQEAFREITTDLITNSPLKKKDTKSGLSPRADVMSLMIAIIYFGELEEKLFEAEPQNETIENEQ